MKTRFYAGGLIFCVVAINCCAMDSDDWEEALYNLGNSSFVDGVVVVNECRHSTLASFADDRGETVVHEHGEPLRFRGNSLEEWLLAAVIKGHHQRFAQDAPLAVQERWECLYEASMLTDPYLFGGTVVYYRDFYEQDEEPSSVALKVACE